MSRLRTIDEDALVAATDVFGRAGAKSVEYGWEKDLPGCDPDDPLPAPDTTWYARVLLRGGQALQTEGHRGPVEAAETLVREILDGGMCISCGRTIALAGTSSGEARPLPDNLQARLRAHGPAAAQDVARAAQDDPARCRWTRRGPRWEKGCE